MTNRTWHKGPPPHVGWWNASARRGHSIWRWWNGLCWSDWAHEDMSVDQACQYAFVNHDAMGAIEWTDYYPENARVPRINPNEVK